MRLDAASRPGRPDRRTRGAGEDSGHFALDQTPDLSEERGSVTVMVALAMTAMLGLLALGIDLGALFSARAEAQRAADAAALAGAAAFLDHPDGEVRAVAVDRAVDFGSRNEIRNEPITPEEVRVEVNVEEQTVRAAVRREGLSTWFARAVGVDAVDVGAEATAWAGAAGAARCVKPFAVPDMWNETTDDRNGNRIWDDDERWTYDPERGDSYAPYSGGEDGTETGYGSHWRDGRVDDAGRGFQRDYGRRIRIKVTDPSQAYVPSFFLPWVLPHDPDQDGCESSRGGSGGGSGRGAARYRQNICSCNTSIIDLDTEYEVEPGNMVGPTYQGVKVLIDQDPDAYWDEEADRVVSEHGMDSPRVVTVALFDPGEIDKPGRQTIRFNNFARIFIEEQPTRQDPVTGRFLYYVPGVGVGEAAGSTKGSLVKVLQLIR